MIHDFLNDKILRGCFVFLLLIFFTWSRSFFTSFSLRYVLVVASWWLPSSFPPSSSSSLTIYLMLKSSLVGYSTSLYLTFVALRTSFIYSFIFGFFSRTTLDRETFSTDRSVFSMATVCCLQLSSPCMDLPRSARVCDRGHPGFFVLYRGLHGHLRWWRRPVCSSGRHNYSCNELGISVVFTSFWSWCLQASASTSFWSLSMAFSLPPLISGPMFWDVSRGGAQMEPHSSIIRVLQRISIKVPAAWVLGYVRL